MHWIAAVSIVVLVVTGLLHRQAVLRHRRRGERPLPDGLDAVRPLRRGGGARGHGDRARLLALRRATSSSGCRRCSRCGRATGSTCSSRSSSTYDPAGEGAPLPRPQSAAAAVLHRRSTSWPRSGGDRLRAVRPVEPGGFFYHAVNWVGRCSAACQIVRFIHHVLTWCFLIFVPIHVYLAMRADSSSGPGPISSIISGGRFVPADEHYVDD